MILTFYEDEKTGERALRSFLYSGSENYVIPGLNQIYKWI